MCFMNCEFENDQGECKVFLYLNGWICPHDREEEEEIDINQED